MVLIINKRKTKKEIDLLFKDDKVKTNGNLSSHFGKLKRNLDGLEYQLKVRNN